jgi:hypothetical protein
VYSDCPRCGADNLTDRPVCPSCYRIIDLDRESRQLKEARISLAHAAYCKDATCFCRAPQIPSEAGLLDEDAIYHE